MSSFACIRSHGSRVDHDSRGICQLLSRLVFDLAALAVEYTVAWYSRLRGGNVESILPHIPQTSLPCGIQSKRQKMQVTQCPLPSPPGYLPQALVFKNLPKSSVVATPSTNLRLASVTTANSCFPLPSTPPLKNSSSSSSGVSMSMTL